MAVIIGWWVIPLLLTIISWCWAVLTPPEPTYGWVPDLKPAFRGFGALLVTLAAWLTYFIIF